ncbi:3-hydroxyacyl-ACP dehydratase [Flavobacterium muglaense]|uniref:3-hydroxyacyl-ACP dehydratase n=1 Tax=Flavobacterium muglaense TaxID=2764716 RepID=A0A923SFM9_9FLAO|nr:3-hydroxyacyl-ACP dehydratase [Flavobacterium muglaense]MBC5837339.1 3-hydroxyacyl-ACP dehydratase [Flavobacterium muglaense]MBC5843929.1 3-hydroxyacyl-ACP dehydratase [Flavobacterium muglaense]
MLLKDFYTITSLENNEGQKYSVTLMINPKHEVFGGHFPGNPIMPGVCMMQIIKELTEKVTESTLLMESLSNVKFMALINPDLTPELRLEMDVIEMEEGKVKVKNTTYFGDTVALKLVSVYKKIG